MAKCIISILIFLCLSGTITGQHFPRALNVYGDNILLPTARRYNATLPHRQVNTGSFPTTIDDFGGYFRHNFYNKCKCRSTDLSGSTKQKNLVDKKATGRLNIYASSARPYRVPGRLKSRILRNLLAKGKLAIIPAYSKTFSGSAYDGTDARQKIFVPFNQSVSSQNPDSIQAQNVLMPGNLRRSQSADDFRWWLTTSVVLAVACNIYVLNRYKVRQSSRVIALRSKISQDLHDNVGAALSSISMFCHAAMQRHDNGDLQESNKILEKIGEASRDIMKDLNDSVWLINPVNDSLHKIIQRISNYALPLCRTKNIYFEINATDSIQHLELSLEKRKAIYLLMKEAINNCLKYASAQNLWVKIVKHRHSLHVSVKDDGVGFSINHSCNGNGLNNMKIRSREINGVIEVSSVIRKGTEIKLMVPLTGVA